MDVIDSLMLEDVCKQAVKNHKQDLSRSYELFMKNISDKNHTIVFPTNAENRYVDAFGLYYGDISNYNGKVLVLNNAIYIVGKKETKTITFDDIIVGDKVEKIVIENVPASFDITKVIINFNPECWNKSGNIYTRI